MSQFVGIRPVGRLTAFRLVAALMLIGSILVPSLALAWNVSDGPVTISKVHINGKASDVTVVHGSTVTVALHYKITDSGCPGCVDQIEVGFSDGNPNQCIYNGIPGPVGASGNATFTLTAPATPGSYFIAYDRAQDFGCLVTKSTWWNGTPNPNTQFLGHITVT